MKVKCILLAARNFNHKNITLNKIYDVIKTLPKYYIRIVNDNKECLNYPLELFEVLDYEKQKNKCKVCGNETDRIYCSVFCFRKRKQKEN